MKKGGAGLLKTAVNTTIIVYLIELEISPSFALLLLGLFEYWWVVFVCFDHPRIRMVISSFIGMSSLKFLPAPPMNIVIFLHYVCAMFDSAGTIAFGALRTNSTM